MAAGSGTAQWGDPRILNRILRESRYIHDPRARRVFQRAAVQTGLVESGGRNLSGGDADSAGWRQERRSLYRNPTNVNASVRRFRQEFEKVYRPGLKSYQAAAMIQRPREDLRGRYHDVARAAASVLGDRGAGGGSGGVSGTPGSPGSVGAQNVAMGSTGALAAIAALTQQKPSPPQSTLPAPSFAAAPTLPKGYAGVQTGGGPEPKGPDLDALLEQIRTPGGDVQLAPGVAGTNAVTGGIGSSRATRGNGRVVLSPGADRPGVRTGSAVLDFARQVSGIAGMTLRIGTGTRHSRMTVDGNVSDHWSGNAADIPATGKRLIRLGQAALIAAGMDPAKARKQTGGLYNVGGHQVIFNTHQGGDHTNHLHISARKRRR